MVKFGHNATAIIRAVVTAPHTHTYKKDKEKKLPMALRTKEQVSV